MIDPFCGSGWSEIYNFPWELWSFLSRPERPRITIYIRGSKELNMKEVVHKTCAALYFEQNVVFVCFYSLDSQTSKEDWVIVNWDIRKRNNVRPLWFSFVMEWPVLWMEKAVGVIYLSFRKALLRSPRYVHKQKNTLLVIYVICQMSGDPEDYLSMIQSQHTRPHWETQFSKCG